MSRNRRSTIWYGVMLLALAAAGVVGVRFVTTYEECDDSPTATWVWFPPGWECPRRF